MSGGKEEGMWEFLREGPAGSPPGAPAASGPRPAHFPTHVRGFDEALAGGIPRNAIVVLVGGPGTMKSLFAFWVLFHNALRDDVKGIYLTLEQGAASFQRQMAVLGMDLGVVEDRVGLVDVATLRQYGFDHQVDWVDFIVRIARRAADQGAELLVVDSIEALEGLARFRNPRHDIFRLYEGLREVGLTAFMISERYPVESGPPGRRVEDFLADGIIEFRFHPISEYEVQRRVRCLKLRGCRHETSSLALLWDEGALRVAKAIAQQANPGPFNPEG
jgi:KaiC/GvpD/RAD55 family RecA-like ATPase